MITALMVAAISIAPPALHADTTLAVERGTRLQVENHRGEVVVEAWARNAVQATGDLADGQQIDVSRSGSVLRIRPHSVRGGHREADLRLRVPAWMDVSVQGHKLDVGVRGTAAEVIIKTVGGDVVVEGGRGLVSIGSIQGEVAVRGARGHVEVTSVNEDIALDDVQGEIQLETTNGDIIMRGIRSANARATTVNGDVVYDGTITNDGRYAFATHNGDLSVSVPAGANATVSVSTYHGEFQSEFPVRLNRTVGDRQFQFTLGSGQARIDLESFNGEIQLRRPR